MSSEPNKPIYYHWKIIKEILDKQDLTAFEILEQRKKMWNEYLNWTKRNGPGKAAFDSFVEFQKKRKRRKAKIREKKNIEYNRTKWRKFNENEL